MGIGDINLERKKEICAELGDIDIEIYDELVQDFIDQTTELVGSLSNLISAEALDWGEICRLAHSIKGSARNLRIPVLGDLAWSLEENANAKQEPADFVSDLDKLNTQFKEFCSEYKPS
ncbi:MAG: HPt (histidine-containing phosphotransfer) domain-containing protein [Candidatus Omnitrophota bacterium]|jgi:HPt (histidine-containing phosphotransfer) domain-containing protein